MDDKLRGEYQFDYSQAKPNRFAAETGTGEVRLNETTRQRPRGQRMDTQPINELGGFQRFVTEKVHNGETTLSPEQVLDEWRVLHPDPDEFDEDLAAIQEAIDDMENGDRGIPFDEFDRNFRAEHNLPAKP